MLIACDILLIHFWGTKNDKTASLQYRLRKSCMHVTKCVYSSVRIGRLPHQLFPALLCDLMSEILLEFRRSLEIK